MTNSNKTSTNENESIIEFRLFHTVYHRNQSSSVILHQLNLHQCAKVSLLRMGPGGQNLEDELSLTWSAATHNPAF